MAFTPILTRAHQEPGLHAPNDRCDGEPAPDCRYGTPEMIELIDVNVHGVPTEKSTRPTTHMSFEVLIVRVRVVTSCPAQ